MPKLPALVLEQKQAGWRNQKHAQEWLASLRRVAFPRIGKVPVSEVSSADVLEILTPIWHRKADTARRVRLRLRAVLEWAVAMEYRIDNPCDRIGTVLGVQQHVAQHMRALPHREVAAAIETVRGSTALEAGKLAFEYLVLTAARWSEVRWAEWAEIDRSGRVWTIPARRMKMNRQHRVPLCGRPLEILEEAQALGEGAGPLVFTRRGGKPLNDKELWWMVRELGIAAVPHGFRSSFRDWAAEETDHPREVIEAALAHVVRNRVEAAYARSDLFERRRRLMDDWARLSGPRDRLPGPAGVRARPEVPGSGRRERRGDGGRGEFPPVGVRRGGAPRQPQVESRGGAPALDRGSCCCRRLSPLAGASISS